jgi:LysM repeat protein
MAARNPARYLAPVAIVATIAGGYLIVHDNLTAKHATHPPRASTVSNGPTGKYRKQRYYTVQAGDSLIGVSNRTGVPVQRLESLNPTINPNSLSTGQRLRLRR